MTAGRPQDAISAIESEVGGRRLVWFGIRGEDGDALLQIEQFSGTFAITAPLRAGSIAPEANVSLETALGRRPDLDEYDIDLDRSDEAVAFKRQFLRNVSGRAVVVTYRPAAFISALAFAMSDTMTLAGMFKDRQAAFEHKPWVETSLAARGVRTLRWRYVPDTDRERAKRLLDRGPLVLRASRSSGGVGIVRVDSVDEIDAHWPQQPDEFVGVAPYIDGGVPLNVSGCVFANGVVRLHPPSLQLIGVPVCTTRTFGYCGNDFGAASRLDGTVLDQLDELARTVGRWLHEERYRGAFGLDAMLVGDEVVFTEVNPRFQGSSALSAAIAAEVEVTDLYLDHVAASLGLAPPDDGLTMAEWAAHQPPMSHVVVHNLASSAVVSTPGTRVALPAGVRLSLVPGSGLRIDSGGVLGRLVVPSSVTCRGFELDPATTDLVTSVCRTFEPAGSARL
jgi:hypothetical protein